MLRAIYAWLIRLHPPHFRQRFGAEMLAIFDEVAGSEKRLLFGDAAASLVRQWVLRPEFRREPAPERIPARGTLMFAGLDDGKPRSASMLKGALVSIGFLCVLTAAIVRPGKPPSWFIGTHMATDDSSPVSRSSLTETEPNTLVRFSPEPENLWRAVASAYFKLMPVLEALDANKDFEISPWEIVTAPSALRRLDRNHDGSLSAEECGFRPGASGAKAFMHFHPVLAALDTDGDGEISAAEILNSARALRKLDLNGDGFLTPDEIMPEAAASQAWSIFQLLDTNHDGRISATELASDQAGPLREVMTAADRNRDGVTTVAELTRELRIREEAAREKDNALKAAHAGK